MDPIHAFVNHLLRARYDDLSREVVDTVKMTILDTMGAAIAGSASDAHFTEEAIRDPELLAMAAKVTTRVDPAKDALPMLYPPSDVTIETTDGRVYVGCEKFVKGHPSNPFTLADCVERFMSCAAWSATPLGPQRLRRFVEMVENLEHVKDAGEMVYNASSTLGDGANDFASIVKVFETWAKTQVKSPNA